MKRPGDLRSRVLEALAEGPAASPTDLADALGLQRRERLALRTCVRGLVMEGLVVELKNGRLRAAGRGDATATGRLRVERDGSARVELDDGRQVSVAAGRTGEALHGDRVTVDLPKGRPRDGRRGRRGGRAPVATPQGMVRDVVERSREHLVGLVERSAEGFALRPVDPRMPRLPLLVPLGAPDVAPGDAVLATLPRPGGRPGRGLEVTLRRRLGAPGDAGTIVAMVLAENDIEPGYPEGLLPAKLREPDSGDLPGREDCRSQLALAVDPSDAKDHDDAVAIEPAADGSCRLWVHIADVSHYVPAGEPLDDEARRRGTTVYYPGGCVPMLPPALSADLCSLLTDRDRLALTCEIRFHPDGRIRDYRLFPSVVRVAGTLSYEEAEQELADAGQPGAGVVAAALAALRDLTERRKALRAARGGLDLFLAEAVPVMDGRGRLADVVRQENLYSYRIIEECMLAANECVARYAQQHKVPILYRLHPAPGEEQVAEVGLLMDAFGVPWKDLKLHTPPGWAKLLSRIAGLPNEVALLPYLIRSQMRATYAARPSGHFGLALGTYCHFTSPIRRYPDLWTHRVLKAHLARRRGATGGAATAAALEALAEHTSVTERRADVVDREVLRRMSVELLADMRGCQFSALVTSVQPYGMFIQVERPFVDGMIPVGDLGDDYYRFHPEEHRLVGRSSRRTFRLGDRFKVVLTRIDLQNHRLDFIPADLYVRA